MSTRDLLRHIFRHGPWDKVGEDALPLGLKTEATKLATHAVCETAVPKNSQRVASSILPPPPKTPEPFGLEGIAEEDTVDTPSPTETVSLTETPTLLDLEISTFSTRELVLATLDEAKSAADFHFDTIATSLALLDALDGLSATISELRKELLEKKQACREQIGMLNAVERAIKGMAFAGELQEQDVERNDTE